MKLRYLVIFALLLLFAACNGGDDVIEEVNESMNITVLETIIDEEDEEEIETQNGETLHVPDYIINLEINPYEQTVHGAQRVTFQNNFSYALDRVFLNLPFNAFSAEQMDITLATINLNPAEFSLEGTLLTIYLEEELASGVVADIGLIFEATVPQTGHFTGGNDHAMWFGNFIPTLAVQKGDQWHIHPHYPIGRPFFTASANFHVNITVPQGFVVIAPGAEARTETKYGITTSAEVRLARDFAFALLSDVYNSRYVFMDNGMSIGIHYSNDFEDENHIDNILITAQTAFDYFAHRIGALPYQTFDIIEIQLPMHISMKFPSMTFADEGLFRTPVIHNAIARDIGHQWFYNVVGNNPVTEPWLAHGLVDFLQLGLTMDEEDVDRFMRGVHANLTRATANMEYTELFRGLGYYDSWLYFNRIQHQRGSLLFYSLWQRMGPEVFDDFVRSYYQRYAFSIAASDGLIVVAEEIYGASLEDFFYEWINSPGLPGLE